MTGLLQTANPIGEQKHLLDSLEQSGRQLKSLVSRIGLSPVISSQRTSASDKKVNGPDLMQQLIRAHWPNAHYKGIDLYLLFDQHLPEDWSVDATVLRQILDNLLNNGIKFTREGHILVEIRTRAGRTREQQDLEIQVSDTGRGIDTSDSQRIYAVNEQGSDVAGLGYGGSGLGLHICRRLVAGLGGRLEHTSARGEGSTFRFQLPGVLTAGSGSSKRLKPALLNNLNCRIGVRGPANRVIACLLERIGVSLADLGEIELNRLPGDVQAVICHADRLQAFGCDRYLNGDPNRLVILSPYIKTEDASRGNPGMPGVKELPQPILTSNLEPLMLRIALVQQMADGPAHWSYDRSR